MRGGAAAMCVSTLVPRLLCTRMSSFSLPSGEDFCAVTLPVCPTNSTATLAFPPPAYCFSLSPPSLAAAHTLLARPDSIRAHCQVTGLCKAGEEGVAKHAEVGKTLALHGL